MTQSSWRSTSTQSSWTRSEFCLSTLFHGKSQAQSTTCTCTEALYQITHKHKFPKRRRTTVHNSHTLHHTCTTQPRKTYEYSEWNTQMLSVLPTRYKVPKRKNTNLQHQINTFSSFQEFKSSTTISHHTHALTHTVYSHMHTSLNHDNKVECC